MKVARAGEFEKHPTGRVVGHERRPHGCSRMRLARGTATDFNLGHPEVHGVRRAKARRSEVVASRDAAPRHTEGARPPDARSVEAQGLEPELRGTLALKAQNKILLPLGPLGERDLQPIRGSLPPARDSKRREQVGEPEATVRIGQDGPARGDSLDLDPLGLPEGPVNGLALKSGLGCDRTWNPLGQGPVECPEIAALLGDDGGEALDQVQEPENMGLAEPAAGQPLQEVPLGLRAREIQEELQRPTRREGAANP
jgi:hypothetical protein